MIDKNTELLDGGRVRISGAWHDLNPSESISDSTVVIIDGKHITAKALIPVIEEYEPPKPKPEPFDWFTGALDGFFKLNMTEDGKALLNKSITKRHGDPTHHTYASEDAAEFGLLGTTDVLTYLDAAPKGRWVECEFRHLEEGDVWRLQPAAPKGVKV